MAPLATPPRVTAIEAQLLEDPALKECAVLERERQDGSPEHVAYVVAPADDPGPLLRRLSEAHEDRIAAFVPVSRLPVTDQGAVDVAALARIPVRERQTEAEWERQVAALQGIGRVAAISGPWRAPERRLHRADLFRSAPIAAPRARPEARPAPDGATAASDSAAAASAPEAPPALRHGAPLQERAGEPWVIGQVLHTAPADQEILYVGAEGAERAETYGSQLADAERLLGGLRRLGLAPRDRIVFQLERPEDIIPLFWASMLGGFEVIIAPCPVSYDEESRAGAQLAHVYELFDRPTIVTDASRIEAFRSGTRKTPLAGARVATVEELREGPRDPRQHGVSPDDVAFYALTSGSTGVSKAIALTHRNLIARARGVNAKCYSAEDVVLNWLPFDHIGSISEGHLRPVVLGCKLVYAPKEYILGRPLRLLELIDRHRITHTWAPNFSYSLVSAALERERAARWDLSCVRMLLNAGELITTAAVQRFIADLSRFGLRPSAVQSAFGMAELCSGVTYHQPADSSSLRFHTIDRGSVGEAVRYVDAADPAGIAFASLGTVIPGVSMRIVDPERRVLPERVCGRLQFKGAALSPGYYQNPEANRAFGDDGWFDTGDMGFLADGELVLTGRADAGIIINGANFSNSEIEAVVEGTGGVAPSFVAACAVRPADSAEQKLAVFFHPVSQDEALLPALLGAVQLRLAKRFGIKADFLLPVERSAIPKTEIGKIQHKKLTAQFNCGGFDALSRQVDLLLGNQNTLPDGFYREAWQRKDLVHADRRRGGVTLVLLDPQGLGQRAADVLIRRGAPCVTVTDGASFAQRGPAAIEMRLGEAEDHRALARWLDESGTEVSAIVHALSNEPASGRGPTRRPGSLLQLVQALQGRREPRKPVRLLVVSSHDHALPPGDEVALACAAVRGLLEAVQREVPWIQCMHLDLDTASDEDQALAIAAEVLGSSADEEISYRDGERWVRGYRRAAVAPESKRELPFRKGGTYVVHGDLGGVSLQLLEVLLGRFEAHVLLAGEGARRDDGAAQDALQRLGQQGGKLSLLDADVREPAALLCAVQERLVDRGGVLDGCIHVAEPAAQRALAEETTEGFAAALGQEATAAAALAEIALEHPGAAFVAVGVTGAGAGALGAAASLQHGLAAHFEQRGDRPVHAVELAGAPSGRAALDLALGALLLGGRVVALADGDAPRLRARLVGESPEVERTRLFVGVLDEAPSEHLGALALVDRYGTPARFDLVPMREPERAGSSYAPGSPLQHLPELPLSPSGAPDRDRLRAVAQGVERQAAPDQTSMSAIELQIAEVWKDVLGLDAVGVQDNFFELGGHSLLLTQAQHRLSTIFGSRVTLVDLFKYSTIEALARFIGEGKPRETASDRGQARAEVRSRRRAAAGNDIAVVGMACRFPGASDLETFWQNLVEGRESISSFTEEEALAAGVDPTSAKSPSYVKASPMVADVDRFDAEFFGLTAREADLMDPQHRLFLECAWEAFEVAGYDPVTHEGPVGVYAGAAMNTYFINNILPSRGDVDANDDLSAMTLDSMGGFQLMVAGDKDYLPTRISYKLNLTGPSINVQTACSTGLVAIHMACQAILAGECDMALAGGSSVKAPVHAGHLYQEGMIVSPDGHCRAFDANARGTIFGSGAGAVLLKPLEDAIRDRDPIFAVIKGSAVNNDGGVKVGYMAPSGDGQAAVVAEAMAVANVTPDTVGFVEAHGTGTEMGDPIEISGLAEAFRKGTNRAGYCAVGSVKTNVGHLQITSGTAGFIKAALALHHKVIPPTLHFERPNPAIDFASSPFFVNTEALPWKSEGLRRAGVNSLGIGGTNAHAILEEAPPPAPRGDEVARSTHVLSLSARSPAALGELAARYLAFLDRRGGEAPALADVCYTSNVGRSHFEHRLALAAGSIEALREALAARSAEGAAPQPARPAGARPKILFLFSGQGSQQAGMGRVLFETQSAFRAALERCHELLRGRLEVGLLDVLYPKEGQASPIDRTEYTQPALFAIEHALYEMWRSFGVEPAAVVGHSVGEYVAACAAGVFSLEDGLELIAERARLMAAQPGHGAMAAVFAPERDVAARLERHRQRVSVAAVNGPANTVISGEAAAVQAVLDELAAAGIKHQALRVSHAFHSPLMDGARAPLERFVARRARSAPKLLLLSNLDGKAAGSEITEPGYWSRHLREPVRFADCAEAAWRAGCDHFVELGPRPSLLGLSQSVLDAGAVVSIPTLRPGEDDWKTVGEAVARLYEAGQPIDWARFHAGADRRRVVLPTYPFQRKRHWIEPRAEQKPARALRGRRGAASLLDPVPLSPVIPHLLFNGELSVRTAPFLGDHLVFEQVVISGACHVAMVIDAATRYFGTEVCELSDVVFTRVLVIPEGREVRVQLVLEPQGDDRYAFKLISLNGDRPDSWTGHAEGILVARPEPMDDGARSIDEIRGRCTQEIPTEDFYALQERRRIHLGDSYQWLTAVQRRQGEALGRLDVPPKLRDGWFGHLHPGIIDACFGLMLTCGDLEGDETQVPFQVARVRARRMPEDRSFQAHARVDAAGSEGFSGSMSLLDAAGRPVLEIEGLAARKIAKSALSPDVGASARDLLYELAWQPDEAAPGDGSVARGSWIVLGGEDLTGAELAARLRAQGLRCHLVTPKKPGQNGVNGHGAGHVDEGHHRVAPLDAEGFAELLRRVEEPVAGVVHLWAADPLPAAGLCLDDVTAAQERACGGLLHLVQAIRRAGWKQMPSLWIATRGAQSLGSERIEVAQAPVWGLGRALSVEQPDLPCVRVDLDPGADDNAERLLGELARPGDESEVLWRTGRRYVHRLVRSAARGPRQGVAIDPDATYLVTGGLGALGRRVAGWLCDKGARHLILTSRRAPEQPIPELARLEALGCEVRIVAADVAQPGHVAELLAGAQASMPPIKGVLHLAGGLDDGVLLQQTWERFRGVMAPKIDGSLNLHHATRDLPLDFFVCFSSIASVIGSAAQGNYAAANAFEDALCHLRRAEGRPGLSINWGPWAGSGMAASISERDRERIAAQGLLVIEPDAALAALDALVGGDAAQRTVLSADWSAFQRSAPGGVLPSLLRAFASRAAAPVPRAWMRDEIAVTPAAARSLVFQKLVRAEVVKVLGGAAANELSDNQRLSELGLDSLQAIDLKNRFGSGLGTTLPFTLIFDNPTVQHLTIYLTSTLGDLFVPVSAPVEEAAVERDAPANELESLSEEELLGLLAGELESSEPRRSGGSFDHN
ncbi:SDR family oxidoreductase [Sorangium sp. So ce1128]